MGTTNIILAICLFVATICLDLITDLRLWLMNKPINHIRGFLLRLVGLIPVILLLNWYSILMIGFIYWFLFDGMYNKLRKFNWWFNGSDDPDDAKSDDLLQHLRPWEDKAIKIVGIIFSTLLYLHVLFW